MRKLQKGGQNKPKIYTDRKQFEQAQRRYSDSLYAYENIPNIFYDKMGDSFDPKNPNRKERVPTNLEKVGFSYKGIAPTNMIDYANGPAPYSYKKPVQPVAYQPNGTVSSPQTVSSQQGKSGIWGNEYNKKHPPIYVTNPKDPRIGQYGKDGNQYLYKGPTHPIQKMSRINPQQMDLNSQVNIQGQPLPFPQFQLPQQKGTPVYGPGNTIIGYSNNMQFQPAWNYTGAANNAMNLQDKALLENPEALRKYVMFKDNYKFKQGGSITSNNPPTTSDSLNLYNNALLVDKFYANNPEYKTVPAVRRISTDPSFHKKEIKNIKTKKILTEKDKKILKWHEENLKSALTKTPLSAHMLNQQAVGFYQKEKLRNLIKNGNIDKDIFPLEKYRKDLNDNQYYQREIQHGTLNLNSPYQLFDNRIEPQNQKQYLYNKNGIVDGVTTFQYDPIAIKPTHLRNIDDWQYLNKTYGSKIPTNIPNPTQSTISSLKPELPQQKGTPVYGPGNTIIGYSNNMNFKPAYQYTGAPNNPINLRDKELLANPEALRKYMMSKDNYKFKKGGKYKSNSDWEII